jgi:NADH-quinone oxidoreductase subunit M
VSILDLLILVPIVAAVLVLLGSPARSVALAAAALNAALGLLAVLLFDSSDSAFQFTAQRILLASPELGFNVGVDGMGLIMVLLTVLVTLAAVWVSPAKVVGNERLFYVSVLLIAAGGLGAFCSTDLFFFYAFHELALIPTFLMIGIWGHGRDRVAVAWKITIYLGLGSLVLLAGLVALYSAYAGDHATFSIPDLLAAAKAHPLSAEAQKWIFLPLFLGFGTLVSIFPFHSWAAPAYAAAPTPVAMLHAGVLKKFGLYGMLRLAMPMLPEGFQHWQTLILVLLLGNIILIGLVTIAQRNLDGMLANSSVMHMGYAFLGIACYNSIGWGGAVLMMFAHGISIALLFALCGHLREKLPTLELSELGGVAKSAPFLGLIFAFAAFASIGLPGFANFASEITIFFGAFKDFDVSKGLNALQITTIVALWGVVISAVYMLRAYRNIFQGQTPQLLSGGVADLGFPMRAPVLILTAALLIVGFFPNLLLRFL